jgi:phosphate transport system protein
MTREHLKDKIRQLEDEVLLLGSLVEQATRLSIEALRNRDVVLALSILQDDQLINDKRYAIENNILITIATQQPVAHDLRLLAAILEVISELERMGDYAKGIAKITRRLENCETTVPILDLTQMAELDIDMLHRALTALFREDYQTAVELPKEDDKVDALYNKVFHELVQTMTANPGSIDTCSLLLWVAHNLERMGDRVTNICERTVFIATGELLEMDATEGENPESNETTQAKDSLEAAGMKDVKETKKRVLFLCTGNSCRSQMAEALTNRMLGGRWEAFSAGTQPSGSVHPLTLRVLEEIGISHEGRPKSVNEFKGARFDVVITVCDDAKENCPVWLGKGQQAHFSFVDPAETKGSDEEKLIVFREVLEQIEEQIIPFLEKFETKDKQKT